ncbi:MAG: hypothetical protein U9P42_10915 [Candidatus Fermentibacteria bacterium]|nr:hypothetical protein [Candidatus Fermentibacteria bacterium]
MSLADDWRQRHGQRRSDSRLIVYIVLLLIILFFLARSGNFSKQFADIFLGSQDSSAVETTELDADE